jgi:hypothetical protein
MLGDCKLRLCSNITHIIFRLIFNGNQFLRGGNNCLRYAFSMNGYHIGTLSTFIVKNGVRQYTWSLTGDQSPDWKQAAVDMNMDSVSQVTKSTRTVMRYDSDSP